MNSPSAVKDLIAATAPPTPAIPVGRMIETAGNLRLRKMVGSGMIKLVWNSCLLVHQDTYANFAPRMLGFTTSHQDGTAIHDDYLAGAKSLVHQVEEGLRQIVRLSHAPNREHLSGYLVHRFPNFL